MTDALRRTAFGSVAVQDGFVEGDVLSGSFDVGSLGGRGHDWQIAIAGGFVDVVVVVVVSRPHRCAGGHDIFGDFNGAHGVVVEGAASSAS